MIDTSPLSMMVAQVTTDLEKIADRDGGDGFIRTVAVVVELDIGHATRLVPRCSDDRLWTFEAFLRYAATEIEKVRGNNEHVE